MDKLIDELVNIVGENDVLYGSSALSIYSVDASPFFGNALAVVRPETAEEVSEIIKVANEYKVKIYPRGAGTGTKGGVVPFGGIVIDMKKMNDVEVNEEDLICVAESGAVMGKIKKEAAKKGLFLPPEPGSAEVATIGGFVAVGGSGKRALKYGAVSNYLAGIEVVLPDGKIFSSFYYTHKSPPFPNNIFVGSEGTLGVITKVALRLLPLPENRRTLISEFESFKEAFEVAKKLIKFLPECVEYADEKVAERLGYDGHIIAVEDFSENKKLEEVLGEFDELRGKEEENFWRVRSSIGSLSVGSRKRFYLADDYVVPFSKAVEFEKIVRDVEKEAGVEVFLYSHLDTCNFHPAVIAESLEQALNFEKILEGKISGIVYGEHGRGLKEKINFRRLKECLDERNIMNPEKIFS